MRNNKQMIPVPQYHSLRHNADSSSVSESITSVPLRWEQLGRRELDSEERGIIARQAAVLPHHDDISRHLIPKLRTGPKPLIRLYGALPNESPAQISESLARQLRFATIQAKLITSAKSPYWEMNLTAKGSKLTSSHLKRDRSDIAEDDFSPTHRIEIEGPKDSYGLSNGDTIKAAMKIGANLREKASLEGHKAEIEIADLTSPLTEYLHRIGLRDCKITLSSKSGYVMIQEREDGLMRDITKQLSYGIPEEAYPLFNQEGAQRFKDVIPKTETLLFIDGRLVTGRWQRVLFVKDADDEKATVDLTIRAGQPTLIKEFEFKTTSAVAFTDLTIQLNMLLREANEKESMEFYASSMHTTGRLKLIPPWYQKSFTGQLLKVVSGDENYEHDNMRVRKVAMEAGENPNARSHIMGLFIPTSYNAEIDGSKIPLSPFNPLNFFELDGPRPKRSVISAVFSK